MHDPQVRCHRVRYITFLCRYTIQLYPPKHVIKLDCNHFIVSRFLESLRAPQALETRFSAVAVASIRSILIRSSAAASAQPD
jgi:hypothetical protein